MAPERWRQIEELYHAARERGSSALRGADPELRQDVERLLAQDLNEGILDTQAAELLGEFAAPRRSTRTTPRISGRKWGTILFAAAGIALAAAAYFLLLGNRG
jgi:hypothetical protein